MIGEWVESNGNWLLVTGHLSLVKSKSLLVIVLFPFFYLLFLISACPVRLGNSLFHHFLVVIR